MNDRPFSFSKFGLASALCAVTAMLAFAAPVVAAPELPVPSPLAKVSQRIGLTDITIEYSSPGVKGRTIWGELVPYDELWRTGANKATKITFSEDVTVSGKAVAAGTYSIFTIPGESEWTFILNTDHEQGGTRKYDEAKDVLRIQVKPFAIPHRERMTFLMTDFDNEGGRLTLEWAKLGLAVKVGVDTATQAEANIEAALGEAASTHANAARYLLDQETVDAPRALDLATKAESLDGSWFNKFILARAQAASGQFAEAVASAKAAQELGEKAEYFFWRDLVASSIAEWEAASDE